MALVKVVLLLCICLFLISEICSDILNKGHYRVKRIAYRPRKHRIKPKVSIPTANPWGPGIDTSSVTIAPNTTEAAEDDFADYPTGYFLTPGMTEAPETYDYSESKFNKPHLINQQWKNEYTNRQKTYTIEKSKLHGIAPLRSIKSPDAVRGIFGDDLLR